MVWENIFLVLVGELVLSFLIRILSDRIVVFLLPVSLLVVIRRSHHSDGVCRVSLIFRLGPFDELKKHFTTLQEKLIDSIRKRCPGRHGLSAGLARPRYVYILESSDNHGTHGRHCPGNLAIRQCSDRT